MITQNHIDIDVFKAVNRAIGESDNLDIMATHLSHLLVSILDIHGCTIFVLNPDEEELEILASFGLSADYLNKGPVLFARSLGGRSSSEPIIIRDVSDSGQLQYPEAAKEEGIRGIISLPINFRGRVIGALRLYSAKNWDLSARDLDSLQLLAENIGLAMMYYRLMNALQEVKIVTDGIHSIWFKPAGE
jgi:signal transduction protein with GAF and PtsI domain